MDKGMQKDEDRYIGRKGKARRTGETRRKMPEERSLLGA